MMLIKQAISTEQELHNVQCIVILGLTYLRYSGMKHCYFGFFLTFAYGFLSVFSTGRWLYEPLQSFTGHLGFRLQQHTIAPGLHLPRAQ